MIGSPKQKRHRFGQAILVFALLGACQPGDDPPSVSDGFAQSGCTIDRVIDGDSVHVSCTNGASGNLRLMEFDTPETFRSGCSAELALGTQAKNRLQAEIANAQSIHTETHGPDRYGRLLTQLYLDGRNVADIMVSAGLAVRYSGKKRINWCKKLEARQ